MSEAEQITQEDTGMSSEEKFLGIKSQIGTRPNEDVEAQAEELDIEIVDETPKKDKRVKDQVFKDKIDYEAVDKEISNVGKLAKQRIKKLKYDFHQERRKKEQSARLRDEAIIYAQRVKSENDRLNQLVSDGQQYLGKQAEERAAFATEAAQQKYKEAYEQGNTEAMVKAQEALTRATMDSASAEQFNAQIPQEPVPQQQYVPQRPQVPPPDEEAVAWQAKNQWFGSDPEMTSFAYGIHEKLVRQENVDPKSEDYYTRIDKRMKEVFPDYFGMERGQPPTTTSQSSVVAPATRNNSARPRKVQLTATQVSLAKRLGLTPQQYANQLIKDMSNV